jgi:hypothetical protein
MSRSKLSVRQSPARKLALLPLLCAAAAVATLPAGASTSSTSTDGGSTITGNALPDPGTAPAKGPAGRPGLDRAAKDAEEAAKAAAKAAEQAAKADAKTAKEAAKADNQVLRWMNGPGAVDPNADSTGTGRKLG